MLISTYGTDPVNIMGIAQASLVVHLMVAGRLVLGMNPCGAVVPTGRFCTPGSFWDPLVVEAIRKIQIQISHVMGRRV